MQCDTGAVQENTRYGRKIQWTIQHLETFEDNLFTRNRHGSQCQIYLL